MGMRRALEGVGREHQHEIDAEALPVDGAQIADGGRDVAAEHVDDDLVADLELQPVGDLLLHRDQRRAVIVGAPPFALDDLRALGDFAGIGQAAVALQHPFGVGRGLELFRLDAAGSDDAPAQHRHVLDRRLRRGLLEERAEAVGLGGRNIDEIERRRAVRQRRQELPPQIAVDLGDGDQHRQAEAERQHHRRRQRAGPVDIGDRQPQHGDAACAAGGAPAPSGRRRCRATARTPRSRRRRTPPRRACHRRARSRPRSAARSPRAISAR